VLELKATLEVELGTWLPESISARNRAVAAAGICHSVVVELAPSMLVLSEVLELAPALLDSLELVLPEVEELAPLLLLLLEMVLSDELELALLELVLAEVLEL
jgi:hypothetical protein